jgi:hypothetical protein
LKPTKLSTAGTPFSPNMVGKDKEWTKVGSKWKCKVGTYIFAYCAKWLLTKHLKEVHGLVIEKSKPWEAFNLFDIKTMLK